MTKKNIIKIISVVILLLFPEVAASIPQSAIGGDSKLTREAKLDSLLKCVWRYRSKDPDKALMFSEKAINLALDLRNYSKAAQSYNYLGVIYRNISKFEESFRYYKKALYYARLADDSVQTAYCHNNFGGYFSYKGEYNLALENIFKAKSIFVKLHNLRGVAYTKLQAGLAYSKLHNYDEAINQFGDVIKIRRKTGDTLGVAIAQLLLANAYVPLEKYEKANELLNGCLPAFEKLGDVKGVSVTYGCMAEIKYYKGKYSDALRYRYKTIPLLKKIGYNIGVVENQIGLALCYSGLGKPDSALHYLDLASSLALEIKYLQGYVKVLRTYIDIFSKLGDVNELAHFTRKLIAINDSLYKNEIILQSNEFRKLSKAYSIEATNSNLVIDIQKKNEYLLAILAVAVISLAFIGIIFYQNRKINQRSKQLNAALQDKNKLFGIVAHDLKNPFHSLLGYSDFLLNELEGDYSLEDLKSGIKQMRMSSHKLLEMVENLLHWARSQTGKIKYNPEVLSVKSLIEETLNGFAQNAVVKNIEMKYEVERNLYCFCDGNMLETVLRNLISNSLKFTKSGGKIIVSARKDEENGTIVVSVKDNGIGISRDRLKNLFKSGKSEEGTSGEKGTGLGLILIKEMVEKNKGTISVESVPGKGTEFTFTMPVADK